MSALPTIAALLLMQAVPGDISAEPICAAAQERDTALLHDSRGRPVMEVAINGTGAIPMVVDTAAQVSMMASDLADELHLAPLPGGIMVNGATGVSRSRLFPVDRLCNPLIDRTDIAMVELANSGVTEARGIVGMDQFVGQRLVVDRTAKRIQATESLPEPADYAVIRGRSTPEGFVEIPKIVKDCVCVYLCVAFTKLDSISLNMTLCSKLETCPGNCTSVIYCRFL